MAPGERVAVTFDNATFGNNRGLATVFGLQAG